VFKNFHAEDFIFHSLLNPFSFFFWNFIQIVLFVWQFSEQIRPRIVVCL
jgi:hypothetical protein